MRKILRLTAYVVGTVVALLLIIAGGVYARGTYILNKKWNVPGVDVPVPTDSLSLEHGHHLAITRGCLGCHEAHAQGGVFFDQPGIARIVAPNIARLVDEYTAVEFDRAVRHGVRRDGTALAAMPSDMFSRLTDSDVGAIFAYLRSLTPLRDSLPSREILLLGRVGLATGEFKLAPQYIELERKDASPPLAPLANDSASQGQYVALTSCAECHNIDLRGTPGDSTSAPNLRVMISAYSAEQFAHLMRTGEPAGGRKLGLMAEAAIGRFAHFTDAEVAAIYQYLKSPTK